MKAFIIHLRRAHDRQPQVQRLAAGLPVPVEVMDAVDALDLSDADIDRVYRRHLHRPRYPFALSRSEIACFLSHREAWRSIVDQGLDAGLVLEDDVALEPGFPAAFAAARACLRPGDLIRFPVQEGRERGPEVFAADGLRIIRPNPVGLRMAAQLIGRDAAGRLLAATERFDRPVDTTAQMSWVTGLSPLSVEPSGVREISATLGGSTIQRKKRPLLDKLAREILRPLYRMKVAARSRAGG
ncbi:glycosyltransferase family 25 protein [Kumtagia ephedrae]|uniref:glycosyltransferase family 25 protein n=1 Tax=Kumtagia ephedrae TaxID=2116701 RepID=UPI001A9C908C|nr:glycosyltransferase family 25 protein [Mesorhizobium ephedrae]